MNFMYLLSFKMKFDVYSYVREQIWNIVPTNINLTSHTEYDTSKPYNLWKLDSLHIFSNPVAYLTCQKR